MRRKTGRTKREKKQKNKQRKEIRTKEERRLCCPQPLRKSY